MSRSTVKMLFADLLLVCLLAGGVQAQQGSRRSSGREAYEAAKARERAMQNREMVLQHAGDKASEKETERLRVLAAQMKDDFRRMQVVNNDMMRAASNAQSLDYKMIGDSSGEINKYAKRLKANMTALETSEDGKKKLDGLAPAEMKQALSELDDLVMGFVNSLAVVDTKNQSQSANYLRDIIALSDHIRRHAEKFDRASQQVSQKP